jgi:hypothetical protein
MGCMGLKKLPIADERVGLEILKAFARERSLLTPLRMMHRHVGNAFRLHCRDFNRQC